MTNYPRASDPDRVPYVPAWSDATPPQGQPAPGYGGAPAELPGTGGAAHAGGRRGRAVRKERSVWLSPLVIGLIVVLAAVVGGGIYLYVSGGKSRGLSQGDCLDQLSGTSPHVVDCTSSGTKYQIVAIIRNAIDEGQCLSVTGANIPFVMDEDGKRSVLCLTKLD